ncbi:MAG: cytochrome C biogenesis protein [Anaerolineaceae bacterium]|nr:cytochrome C biogenesis protein [Anaerolineaceae bacterium]
MQKHSFLYKRKLNPLPYVLFAGLFIGLISSWFIFSNQNPVKELILSETPISSPTATLNSPTRSKIVETTTPQISVPETAEIGKPAPDFILKTINGKEVKLSNFVGKAVLINIWASWCPPCRYEMPAIQKAYEKYEKDKLIVLGINFTAQDNIKDVESFVKEFSLTFPILLDETGEVSSKLYGMRGLPTSYFINQDGILKRIQVGAMQPEELEDYLAEIIQ